MNMKKRMVQGYRKFNPVFSGTLNPACVGKLLKLSSANGSKKEIFMPTMLAIIVASISSFLAHKFLKEYSPIFSAIFSALLWGVVYYIMKKMLRDLRP